METVLMGLSASGVAAFALFLLAFAATIAVRPNVATRFLNGFAASARAHYGEQAARLLVGASLVGVSPAMLYPDAVRLFGTVMIVTTLGLLCIPWRWHRRIARRVTPPVVRRLRLFGLAVAALALALTVALVEAWVRRGV